jgi:hypothetical protein
MYTDPTFKARRRKRKATLSWDSIEYIRGRVSKVAAKVLRWQ